MLHRPGERGRGGPPAGTGAGRRAAGRRGLLQRTTGGKLRRRHRGQLLQEGGLSGTVSRNP